ncbi:MAG: divalent-cation tolerance protein CutA [Candidatus Aureabacteria bacterium]|nr:divalent-cation tolerance protein CutA [Candidatus Auribacterota bacterium]
MKKQLSHSLNNISKNYRVIFCTCPDQECAEKIAHALLRRKLVACVNIIPSVVSLYWWEGKIDRSSEVLLLMKTRSSLFDKIEKSVRSLHPYAVPEIVGLPITRGSQAYLKWINHSVQHENKKK